VDVGGKDFNGKTLLKRGMEEGAWDVVKLAIERTGCRWRARSERDDDGRSVLFLAAMRGRGDIVVLLLDRGATLSARNTDETTLLMRVAEASDVGALEMVISKAGPAAPFLAARQGRGDVVALLLNHGKTRRAETHTGGRCSWRRRCTRTPTRSS
jgi:ankyrin repeat protein